MDKMLITLLRVIYLKKLTSFHIDTHGTSCFIRISKVVCKSCPFADSSTTKNPDKWQDKRM